MKNIKTITAYLLTTLTISLIAISCKREDTFTGYEKNMGKINTVSQSMPAAGCHNEDVEKHFITLQYAYQLIHKFQDASETPGALCEIMGENGWVFFETFPVEAIQKVLSQRGCCKYRVYNGLGEDNRLHFVMVGVNEYGYDYLKCNTAQANNDSCKNIDDLPIIIEMGAPCPEACSGGDGHGH